MKFYNGVPCWAIFFFRYTQNQLSEVSNRNSVQVDEFLCSQISNERERKTAFYGGCGCGSKPIGGQQDSWQV